MRTLAIGDIHGAFSALENLAQFAGFTASDTVITLGDYVDRGPDSKGVIDFLIGLGRTSRLIPLMGNHEIMMLRARDDRSSVMPWLGFGGTATLDSYGAGSFADVPVEHWEFLETLLPYHETETHIFVHANLDPNLPMEEQDEMILYWEPFGEPEPNQSGKTMICGHTSQKSGEVLEVGHAVCIDTYAWGGGWLTCLDVGSGKFWQAGEEGERKTGQLLSS